MAVYTSGRAYATLWLKDWQVFLSFILINVFKSDIKKGAKLYKTRYKVDCGFLSRLTSNLNY